MPDVKPLTEAKKIAKRWHTQDGEFYEQFERIHKLSGMTLERMSDFLGLSVPTMKKYAKCPDDMPKKVERRLVLLAERVGVVYNLALGGGAGIQEGDSIEKKAFKELERRVSMIETVIQQCVKNRDGQIPA